MPRPPVIDRCGVAVSLPSTRHNAHIHGPLSRRLPRRRRGAVDTHELQRLGGWKTGAMVERYAHVAPEALQGAASRLDVFIGQPATEANNSQSCDTKESGETGRKST